MPRKNVGSSSSEMSSTDPTDTYDETDPATAFGIQGLAYFYKIP